MNWVVPHWLSLLFVSDSALLNLLSHFLVVHLLSSVRVFACCLILSVINIGCIFTQGTAPSLPELGGFNRYLKTSHQVVLDPLPFCHQHGGVRAALEPHIPSSASSVEPGEPLRSKISAHFMKLKLLLGVINSPWSKGLQVVRKVSWHL